MEKNINIPMWLNWMLPLVKWFRINHTVYTYDLIIVTRYLKDGTIYHNELCRKCIEQYAEKRKNTSSGYA